MCPLLPGTRLDTLIGALMCRTGNQGDGPENAKNIGPDGDGSEAGILNKVRLEGIFLKARVGFSSTLEVQGR